MLFPITSMGRANRACRRNRNGQPGAMDSRDEFGIRSDLRILTEIGSAPLRAKKERNFRSTPPSMPAFHVGSSRNLLSRNFPDGLLPLHPAAPYAFWIPEGRRVALGASRGRKVRTPQGATPRNPGSAGDTLGRLDREVRRRTVPQRTYRRTPVARPGW